MNFDFFNGKEVWVWLLKEQDSENDMALFSQATASGVSHWAYGQASKLQYGVQDPLGQCSSLSGISPGQ